MNQMDELRPCFAGRIHGLFLTDDGGTREGTFVDGEKVFDFLSDPAICLGIGFYVIKNLLRALDCLFVRLGRCRIGFSSV